MSEAVAVALRVNDLLTRFVAIQREMTALPWWRHLPIPGLFKAIDFPVHESNLSVLLEQIVEARARISHLGCSGGASGSEAEFVTALEEYSAALQEAIAALREMAHKLVLKAEGAFSYDWQQYKQDHRAFTARERNYVMLGNRLTTLFQGLHR